jgi:hypothetical protein
MTTENMSTLTKDILQDIQVKQEKNAQTRETARAAALKHAREDTCTAPTGSSKMPQEREDTCTAPIEDVKAEHRQGDCLFAAIIMQYTARCRALPGMAPHHACLESVKAFRQAIMRWVQTNVDIVSPWYPDALNHKFVKSIGQHRWGGNLELAVAASILQCDIQIIPMKGDAPITVSPLMATDPRGLSLEKWRAGHRLRTVRNRAKHAWLSRQSGPVRCESMAALSLDRLTGCGSAWS